MIQYGEEVLYIARRMVVIASEYIGLADNRIPSLDHSEIHCSRKGRSPRISHQPCALRCSSVNEQGKHYRSVVYSHPTCEKLWEKLDRDCR